MMLYVLLKDLHELHVGFEKRCTVKRGVKGLRGVKGHFWKKNLTSSNE